MSMHRLSALSFSLASGVLFSSLHTAPLAGQTIAPTIITSCVSKLSGVSRIVAAPSACNAAVENVVMWNQQGPIGPQGPVGLTGAAGAQGPQGLTGARGPTGVTGAQGPQGATGAPGLNYAGNWSPFCNWKKNDVVGFQGSSYLAIIDDPVGVFQPTSKQGAAIWNILAAQGATGAVGAQGVAGPMGPQGVAGATGATGPQGTRGLQGLPGREGLPGQTGPQGPAGPTGPQGPAGPSSGLAYTIHFYGKTVTIPGRPENTVGESESATEVCNEGEIGIAASCGYQNTTATADQADVIVNYQGLDTDNLNAGLCLMSNTNTGARTTTVGVSCLAPADTGTSAGKVVKSCTYDPDTQTPCTEADATVFDPVADKAQALARVSALNAAGPAVSSTNGTPKVKRSITLWFRD